MASDTRSTGRGCSPYHRCRWEVHRCRSLCSSTGRSPTGLFPRRWGTIATGTCRSPDQPSSSWPRRSSWCWWWSSSWRCRTGSVPFHRAMSPCRAGWHSRRRRPGSYCPATTRPSPTTATGSSQCIPLALGSWWLVEQSWSSQAVEWCGSRRSATPRTPRPGMRVGGSHTHRASSHRFASPGSRSRSPGQKTIRNSPHTEEVGS